MARLRLTPAARKLGLVTHVGTSVGWLGSVATSLVLAVEGLTAADPGTARAVYPLLAALGWWALLPFSTASLATGLIQALGTRWGLLQHYWVLTKLVMNLFATGVLLLYLQTLTALAAEAEAAPLTPVASAALRNPSPIVHAAGAVALLVVALVLSVYKPRGLTTRGQRMSQVRRTSPDPTPTRQTGASKP